MSATAKAAPPNSESDWIAKVGTAGYLETPDYRNPPFWKVHGSNQRGGSCTWWAHPSVEACSAHAAELMADPEEGAKYTTWEILRFETVVRTSVERVVASLGTEARS